MNLDIWHIAALVLLGLVTGVFGGMLGVGGSIIMIPGMKILLGESQHLYQAAAMIVNVAVVAPAARTYWRTRLAIPRVVVHLVPASIAGIIVGVWLSNTHWFSGTHTANLTRLFASFLCYVTAYNVYRMLKPGPRLPEIDAATAAAMPRWRMAATGGVTGLFAGLLGVGGGVIAIPLQQLLLRIPLKSAIANSACTIVFSALIGAVYKNATLGIDHGLPLSHSLIIAATLIPSAVVGGHLGALLMRRLPRQPVRILFIVMMAAASWRMWVAAPHKGRSKPPASRPAVAAESPAHARGGGPR